VNEGRSQKKGEKLGGKTPNSIINAQKSQNLRTSGLWRAAAAWLMPLRLLRGLCIKCLEKPFAKSVEEWSICDNGEETPTHKVCHRGRVFTMPYRSKQSYCFTQNSERVPPRIRTLRGPFQIHRANESQEKIDFHDIERL